LRRTPAAIVRGQYGWRLATRRINQLLADDQLCGRWQRIALLSAGFECAKSVGAKEPRNLMATAELSPDRINNPIFLVEQIANGNEWACERTTEDELTLTVASQWTDYHVSLNWRDDLETLHIACAFDAKIPENRLTEVYRLVAQINEQLWVGHFDVWLHEGLIMFRQGLMLNGALATPHQCEALLRAALEACERYYQAFQFVMWAGKDSRQALASTMFETEGRA
jgi:hypothetical protein